MPSQTPETTGSAISHRLEVSQLAHEGGHTLRLRPDQGELAAMAAELGASALRKVSLMGRLEPHGKRDWRLSARLGATIVQPCVVSLAPLTTRVEEQVTRHWSAEIAESTRPGDEIEMPEVTSREPLGRVIDLGQVLIEALALAMPLYPRATDAALDETNFARPGVVAMTDEDARPFAGLAALRNELSDKSGEDDGEDDADESDG